MTPKQRRVSSQREEEAFVKDALARRNLADRMNGRRD